MWDTAIYDEMYLRAESGCSRWNISSERKRPYRRRVPLGRITCSVAIDVAFARGRKRLGRAWRLIVCCAGSFLYFAALKRVRHRAAAAGVRAYLWTSEYLHSKSMSSLLTMSSMYNSDHTQSAHQPIMTSPLVLNPMRSIDRSVESWHDPESVMEGIP